MAVIIIVLVLALLFMREMAKGRYVGTGGTLLVLLVILVLIIVGVKSCSSDDDTRPKVHLLLIRPHMYAVGLAVARRRYTLTGTDGFALSISMTQAIAAILSA